MTVVIPYYSYAEQLSVSLASWFRQTYKGHLGIVVVDMSPGDVPPPVGRSRVNVVRPFSRGWNISRAKNIGARAAAGELLVFAHADMSVSPDFVDRIARQWDDFAMWLCDGLRRGVPHDPSLDSLVVVKRWVNTRLRGYNEPMMESPHGWGYDATDFQLRAESMLAASGDVIGEFDSGLVTMLPHKDDDRLLPYANRDMTTTYGQHAAYSSCYRSRFGFEANIGQTWGSVL